MLNRKQKKALRRTLMMTLAVIFLVEAWLWDRMGTFVARVIALIPFARAKEWMATHIERLSPWMTLTVFIIPIVVLFPFKLFALWLLAKGFFVSGVLSVIGAKLVGLGVFSFLFTLCKPKLMQLRGIAWLYHQCLHWQHMAHELVRPYSRYIKRYIRAMKPSGFIGKLIWRLRARMHAKKK
jgi:hypothetical protein